MSTSDPLLRIAEQNAKNLSTLADALGIDIEDEHTDPERQKQKAQTFGFNTSRATMNAAMDDTDRAAALLKQNASNIQRLLAGADVAGGSPTSAQKASFMGLE